VAIVVSWVVPAFSLHSGLVDELDIRATSFYQLIEIKTKDRKNFNGMFLFRLLRFLCFATRTC
jgi:hypothetical protein